MPNDLLYDIKNLFLQIGEGNERSFKIIFDLYKERFYSLALKMTHSHEIAEEIVQEVFVTLWLKRLQVSTAGNPEGYLFTMLHNTIYTQFRKLASEKVMRRKIEQQTFYIDPSPVEDALLMKENTEKLESIIGQLPLQQRIVYKLSKQQGLTRQEIAYQLHLSPNTVKNHLQEAVRFIRAQYKAGASAFICIAIWQCL